MPQPEAPLRRRPKLIPNHRVVLKLFPHPPSHPLRTLDRHSPDDVLRGVLVKQRQRYECLLAKHGIRETVEVPEVATFISLDPEQ
jgi:hypothetical protein